MLMTQAVSKLIFGDRDEILIHKVGLSRNNDSPTLPSGFNCCADGLGTGVFTQPGPKGDITHVAQRRWIARSKRVKLGDDLRLNEANMARTW